MGCPNCEFTVQYKIFIQELTAELKVLKRGTWKGSRRWPAKKLLELVNEVASIAHSNEGQQRDSWTVFTTMMVSIYRNEVAKKKTIDNYNLSQSMTPKKPRKGPLIPDDED